MHIINKHGVNEQQLRKLADTINSYEDISKIIIIISGDLTSSGTAEQFDFVYQATSVIIGQIKRNGIYGGDVDVISVPGNHDVQMSESNTLGADELRKLKRDNKYPHEYDAQLDIEHQKLANYYHYAERIGHPFSYDKNYVSHIIDANGYNIEFDLINTAPFSIREEDKGLHYLPIHCINEYGKYTGADFVITIMHHPPEWYIESVQEKIERKIHEHSSLIFVGHRHSSSMEEFVCLSKDNLFIQAGGCLCKNDDWQNSTFLIGVLSTDSFLYSCDTLLWDDLEHQYETKSHRNVKLARKSSIERVSTPTAEFIENICADPKRMYYTSFSDYFVFPRIREENINTDAIEEFTNTEYSDEASFVTAIMSHNKALIIGDYNSGKTTLLKHLFITLTSHPHNYYVILCDINTLKNRNSGRLIENSFREIYGNTEADYTRFKQSAKSRRVLILDNIDYISEKQLNKFTKSVQDKFGHFIYASSQIFSFEVSEIVEKLQMYFEEHDNVATYRISDFYADKRNELIDRVVALHEQEEDKAAKLTSLFIKAIKGYRRLFDLTPDTIIQFVEFGLSNIKEFEATNSNIFNRVFEANITFAINEHCKKPMTIDKVFVLLGKISYRLHYSQTYPIEESFVRKIVEDYNLDFGDSVDYQVLLRILLDSRILIDLYGNQKYKFNNKHHLAYFVAREVNMLATNDGNYEDILTLIERACFPIESDIILFISYITDNRKILRLLLESVNKFADEWDEFDFKQNFPDLLRDAVSLTINVPSALSESEELSYEIEQEKLTAIDFTPKGVYDHFDSDIESIPNQLLKLSELLSVIAKVLPNFEHNLLADDKANYVKSIYELPNKIFYRYCQFVESNKDQIINSIMWFIQKNRVLSETRQETNAENKSVDEEENKKRIKVGLQNLSMYFLLSFYDIAAEYSAKDNSIQYLSSFDYSKEDTYGLEHLLMLEKVNAGDKYTTEAVELLSREGEHSESVFSNVLRQIVRQGIIHMSGGSFSVFNRQRLMSVYFPPQKTSDYLPPQQNRTAVTLEKLNRERNKGE